MMLFVPFVLASLTSAANTMGPVLAKVTDVGTYANGSIYVFFDRPISSCNPNNTRMDVSPDNPSKDQVFSIAMTAFVSGKSTVIYPSSCNGASASFESGQNSYFYLTSQELAQ